jgi:hypothetical protein
MLGCKCVRAHVHHVFGHNHIFGCFEIRDLDSANCFIVKPTPNNHRPAAHLIVLRPWRFDFPGFSIRKLEKYTVSPTWKFGHLGMMPLIKHHWMIPLVKPYSKSSRRSNHWILLDLLLRSWKKHKFASFFEICFIFIWVWLGWSVDLGSQRLLTPSFANSEVRPGITSWHRALLSGNAAMPQCRNSKVRPGIASHLALLLNIWRDLKETFRTQHTMCNGFGLQMFLVLAIGSITRERPLRSLCSTPTSSSHK